MRTAVRLLLIGLGAVFLAAILWPGISSRPTSPRVSRTKAQLQTIVNGVRAYCTEYGSFPVGDNPSLMRILKGDNPRKMLFLDPACGSYSKRGEFLDQWGTPY